MTYAKLSFTEFYSCYLQQCHSIDLFSYRLLAMTRRVILISLSVLLFRSFLGIGSLVFSGTPHGVRGPCGVVYDKAKFFEKNVLPPKWGK